MERSCNKAEPVRQGMAVTLTRVSEQLPTVVIDILHEQQVRVVYKTVLNTDCSAVARFGRIHFDQGALTDEEEEERERLLTRQNELVNLAEDD